jgi:hypothetical protein
MFDSRQEERGFSLLQGVQAGFAAHRPTQCMLGAPSVEVKRQEREADHPPPTNAEVRRGEIISLLHLTSSLHGN